MIKYEWIGGKGSFQMIAPVHRGIAVPKSGTGPTLFFGLYSLFPRCHNFSIELLFEMRLEIYFLKVINPYEDA